MRGFPYRNHRCYYLVTDEEIRVLGFIDIRRDLNTALEERLPHLSTGSLTPVEPPCLQKLRSAASGLSGGKLGYRIPFGQIPAFGHFRPVRGFP